MSRCLDTFIYITQYRTQVCNKWVRNLVYSNISPQSNRQSLGDSRTGSLSKKSPSCFAKTLTISLSFTPDDSEKKTIDLFVIRRPWSGRRIRAELKTKGTVFPDTDRLRPATYVFPFSLQYCFERNFCVEFYCGYQSHATSSAKKV